MRRQFRLLIDIHATKLFAWLLVWMFGPIARLDLDLFLYVRYTELADSYRSRERRLKAIRLEAIAEAHYQAAPPGGPALDDDDPPPEAAAAAMPVPRPRLNTRAIGAGWPRTITRVDEWFDRASESPL